MRKILENKNGESMATNKLLIILLIVFVIVLVLFFIFRINLLSYFQSLPGPENQDKDISNLRDIVTEDRCPVMIGKIDGVTSRIYFCGDLKCSNDKNKLISTNLKYDYKKELVFVIKRFWPDSPIGGLANNIILIRNPDATSIKLNNTYFSDENTICKKNETKK
jgi:hypothetical protein